MSHLITSPSPTASTVLDPAAPTSAVSAAHPAGSGRVRGRHLVAVPDLPAAGPDAGEEGSLVAEYGLLAVVSATVTGVLISWAGSGALASFFGQLLDHARSLVVS
ncbi:MAG: hypothetical protein WEB03_08135 [Nitriliruptor sp.]|uniref:hypothetical protein n=1 Tax=Nitriliruptor sp. TaxID=2448056 RepID=UPI0034A07A9A